MLLTIKTYHHPATDIGFLLHKHPDKVQSFSITGGKVHVFYPEANEDSCTVAMLMELNSIDLVRKLKVPGSSSLLKHYINDRPYVASSFTSHAIAKVFSSALNGKCANRQDLLETPMSFDVKISVLKVRGGLPLLEKIFQPLGYIVSAEQHPLDENFEEWGSSPYYTVLLQTKSTKYLKALLTHLYVLLPVFDNEKHYWIGKNEADKLLQRGEGWLAQHPEKEWITRRYLKNFSSLSKYALKKMLDDEYEVIEEDVVALIEPEKVEKKQNLHQQRLNAALEKLKESKAKSVLDLGCGEGKLLRMLLKESQFERILGMDVSFKSLQRAKEKLYMDNMAPRQKARINLIQGALTYYDERLKDYDAAAVIEVIEHLELDRIPAFEKVLFEVAKPQTVVLTTPNAEYNVNYNFLQKDSFRHSDHRFEWTRAEFQDWTKHVCETYGYSVNIFPIGEETERIGAPSQMAVFSISQ